MFKEKFALSVIIPTYNRSEGLEHTIRSLLSQDIDKSEFEIIIADDGSTDDSFQVVKKYEHQANIAYTYQIDKGYRPSSARNMGIRIARGKICLFIDSGIVLKSNCLRSHIDFHNRHSEELAVIGYTYGYTQHGQTEDQLLSMIDVADPDGSIAKLVTTSLFLDIRERIYQKYQDKLHELDTTWTLFWGGHLSVPLDVLHRIGGFDEQFDGNWGCEDNDLGYRILQEDIKLYFCREAKVLHLPHGTDIGSKAAEGITNCRYFHEKYKTPETAIFLDSYLKEITGHEVIDFHALFVGAREAATL